MSAPFDFTFAVDVQRERRIEVRRVAEAARVDAEIAAAELRQERERALRRQGLSELQISALGKDTSLSHAPLTVTGSLQTPHFAGTASASASEAEQEPTLRRLGRLQRVKEFFRPALRQKRVLEELAIAEAIDAPTKDLLEQPSLPGAGLLKLQELDERSLPPSPIDNNFDADMTRGGDDEITALPSLPARVRPFYTPMPTSRHQDEMGMGRMRVEDLANQAMDEAKAAYDSPGNRTSRRLSLPAEWRQLGNYARAVEHDGFEQQVLSATSAFLPLPDLSGPGLPLPDLSVPAARSATTLSLMEETLDDAQTTPASGKWFGS